MRKNKMERFEKYKCGLRDKCRNKGITGVYFRDGCYWCSKSCWKRAKAIAQEKVNEKKEKN